MRLWLHFACAAVLLTAGCARHRADGLTPLPPGFTRDWAGFRDVSPRWSHDGHTIAFVRTFGDRTSQVCIANRTLASVTPLLAREIVNPDRPPVTTLDSASSPDSIAWSPDDRRVAFERSEWFSFEDGHRLPGTSLWQIDVFSGEVTPLAVHPVRYAGEFYYYHDPAWSADGAHFAFIGESILGKRALCVTPVLPGRPARATPRFDRYADSDWPAWQPTVGGLAFRQGLNFPYEALSTETVRFIHPGDPRHSDGELWRMRSRDWPAGQTVGNPDIRTSDLAWSPDGARLAFAVTPNPSDRRVSEVWWCEPGASKPTRVSPASMQCVAPVWISDTMVGMLSRRGAGYDVIVADVRTRLWRKVGTVATADCDWSPDRTAICYAEPEPSPEGSAATTLRLMKTGLAAAGRQG